MTDHAQSTLSFLRSPRKQSIAAGLAIAMAMLPLPIRGGGCTEGQPSTFNLQLSTVSQELGRHSPGRPWLRENRQESDYTADGASAGEAQSDAMALPPFFVMAFGTATSGNGQFLFPSGVALDRSGNVYVADNGNGRIQEFTSSGAFLAEWGTWGSGDGQFELPIGVAFDGAGDVYVTDSGNGRVEKFDPTGKFLMKFGSLGSGDGQFVSPGHLTVDSAGNVYVLDFFGCKVLKFDSGGNFIKKWGAVGSAAGQFLLPSGITTGVSGNVLVGRPAKSKASASGKESRSGAS